MYSLHQADYVHRDLKPENILIDTNIDWRHRAFIADVGVAKDIPQDLRKELAKTYKGSPLWCAPEVAKNILLDDATKVLNQDLFKSDIFSLGLIILYCLDPREFQDKNEATESRMNTNKSSLHDFLTEFQKRKNLPSKFFDLLKSMVSWNANDRPSIVELYQRIVQV